MFPCALKHIGIVSVITQISKEDHCVFRWLVECCELTIDSAGGEQHKNVTEGNIKKQIRRNAKSLLNSGGGGDSSSSSSNSSSIRSNSSISSSSSSSSCSK